MADILFYEDSIIFDPDDPDFLDSDDRDHINNHAHTLVKRHNFPSDRISSTMYCKMIHSLGHTRGLGFEYHSNDYMFQYHSTESFINSRLESMIERVNPDFHDGQVDEASMTLESIRCQMNSCNSCGVSWSDNHVSLDCKECGGYSLTRPCPMCDGKCKSKWSRDVSMSHSVGKAHWEGECSLAKKKQLSVPSFLEEDILIQGIEDLSASNS